MDSSKHLKIFISYSHDSPAHGDRVLALSQRLRADGIDARVDQYEIAPPEGWPRWMDRQIREADFVLSSALIPTTVESWGSTNPDKASESLGKGT